MLLLGFGAGVLSGAGGFGGGLLLGVLCADGVSLAASFGIVKLHAAVNDTGSIAGFRQDGHAGCDVRWRDAIVLLGCGAAGACLLHYIAVERTFTSLGILGWTALCLACCGAGAMVRAGDCRSTTAAGFGLYVGMWGFGAGTVYALASVASRGASYVRGVAQSRSYGAIANLSALAALALLGDVDWSLAGPLLPGLAGGAFAGSRWLARTAPGEGRSDSWPRSRPSI